MARKTIINLYITTKNKYFLILLIAFLFFNCNKDRCNEGYKEHTVNGQEICIPEFLAGKESNFELGNYYSHPEHGLIILENGIWKNQSDQIIKIEE
ncbi:hypothetical protein C7447_1011008 [Tenacibaculum adriaticum]|uniref:WG repeat protein n=1 Tax=Tenacibaculum adriaticum TaxID=413713 RepID=A0A5S5DXE3_9FLAO|nr:hypothetical protein [Tenacibaculum adriaticum]TYQ00395.1 hypothetical protein C7447_1011008 [Tenacibaculum adriaticum]